MNPFGEYSITAIQEKDVSVVCFVLFCFSEMAGKRLNGTAFFSGCSKPKKSFSMGFIFLPEIFRCTKWNFLSKYKTLHMFRLLYCAARNVFVLHFSLPIPYSSFTTPYSTFLILVSSKFPHPISHRVWKRKYVQSVQTCPDADWSEFKTCFKSDRKAPSADFLDLCEVFISDLRSSSELDLGSGQLAKCHQIFNFGQ